MATGDRLQSIDEKIEALKAQKQKLVSQLRTRERKQRTRRLIEVGAIFEKNFNLSSKEEAEHVAHSLRDQVEQLLNEFRKK